jgi:LytS/YehU family sensor histidine kinase
MATICFCVAMHTTKVLVYKSQVFDSNFKFIIPIFIMALIGGVFLASVLFALCSLIESYERVLKQFQISTFLINMYTLHSRVLFWLAVVFVFNIVKRDKRLLQSLELEALRGKEYQLELLKSKIQPHFLFNTLNVIKALIRIDASEARNSINALSDLLRYTLNYSRRNLVRLSEELIIIEQYIGLHKKKFSDNLNIRYVYDNATAEALIPSTIVLTVVENAIKHGIHNESGYNEIKLEIDLTEDDKLRIAVINQGTFFGVLSNDTILEKHTSEGGFGLLIVARVLNETYGSAAQIKLEGRDKEVVATIILPKLFNY